MTTLQRKLSQISKLVDLLEAFDSNTSKDFLNQLNQIFSSNFLHKLTESLVKDKEYVLLQNVLPIISEVNSDSEPDPANDLVVENTVGSTRINDVRQLDLLSPTPDIVLNGVTRTSEAIQIITLRVFSRCSSITRTQSYFPVRRQLEENNLLDKDGYYEEVSTYVNEEKKLKNAVYCSHHKCHKLIDSAIESLLRKKWLSYGSTEKAKNKPICITQEGLNYLEMIGETISEVKA